MATNIRIKIVNIIPDVRDVGSEKHSLEQPHNAASKKQSEKNQDKCFTEETIIVLAAPVFWAIVLPFYYDFWGLGGRGDH